MHRNRAVPLLLVMAIVYAACLVGTAAEPRNDIVVGKFIVEPPRVTNH